MDILEQAMAQVQTMVFGAIVPQLSNLIAQKSKEQGATVIFVIHREDNGLFLSICKAVDGALKELEKLPFNELKNLLAGNLDNMGDITQAISGAESIASMAGVPFKIDDLLNQIAAQIADSNAILSEALEMPVRFILGNKIKNGMTKGGLLSKPRPLIKTILYVFVEKYDKQDWIAHDEFLLAEMFRRLAPQA